MSSRADSGVSEGVARRKRIQGRKADELQGALSALDAGLASWADHHVFESVWGRPGLGERDRTLIAIAVLGAIGASGQLRVYLHGALQAGIREVELRETLVMLSVYVGFPASINAMQVLADVVASEERAEVRAGK
jgi:4-carboxymuconolactone decarboxylase